METLAEILDPYKDTIGPTASVVTILQFFSGAFICKDIYNKRSTKGFSSMPFVGGIVIGVLVLKFALLLNDPNMFNVNVAAIILNSFYLVFYINYALDKYQEVIVPAFKGSLLIAVLLTYVSYEDPELVEFRYSFILTALMLLLMGSPLVEVNAIVANKDASAIPFPMTFMGFIVTILWFLYGIILRNSFMVIQNVLGTLLCFVQLVLIVLYPGTDKKKKDKSKKKD